MWAPVHHERLMSHHDFSPWTWYHMRAQRTLSSISVVQQKNTCKLWYSPKNEQQEYKVISASLLGELKRHDSWLTTVFWPIVCSNRLSCSAVIQCLKELKVGGCEIAFLASQCLEEERTERAAEMSPFRILTCAMTEVGGCQPAFSLPHDYLCFNKLRLLLRD